MFDYLTVILPRRLLSTATARYSTHPLDVDNRTQPLMSTSVDINTKRVNVDCVGVRCLGMGSIRPSLSMAPFSEVVNAYIHLYSP